MGINTETTLDMSESERLWSLSPNGCYHRTPPLKAQGCMGKKRWGRKTVGASSSRRLQGNKSLADTTWLMHTWTHRQHAHDLHKCKADEIPAEQRGGNGHKILPKIKKPVQKSKDWSSPRFSPLLFLFEVEDKAGSPRTYPRLTVYVIESSLELPDPPASDSEYRDHMCVTQVSWDIQMFYWSHGDQCFPL